MSARLSECRYQKLLENCAFVCLRKLIKQSKPNDAEKTTIVGRLVASATLQAEATPSHTTIFFKLGNSSNVKFRL